MENIKQLHAKEISVLKKTSVKNLDSPISDEIVAKADSVKMSLERNQILTRFEEYIRDLQALVDDIADRKVTMTDAMERVGELFQSGPSVNKSENSVNILKLKREVQRPTDLIESKVLELQMVLGLSEETICLQGKIS